MRKPVNFKLEWIKNHDTKKLKKLKNWYNAEGVVQGC